MGGAVSAAIGGNFGEGFRLGALTGAVAFGTRIGLQELNEYLNNKNTWEAVEKLLVTEKERAEAYDSKKPVYVRRNDPQGEMWDVLNRMYKEFSAEIEWARHFDVGNENMLKFGNWHIRLEGSQVVFHRDSFDIVTDPIKHIAVDTIYGYFKYGAK